MKGRQILLPAILAVTLGGCEEDATPRALRLPDGAPSRPVTEERDSAGIPILTNRGPGLLETAGTLALREAFRAGGIDPRPEEQFYEITGMTVDASGDVFVANSADGTIRVFTIDGDYVRTFGGLGDGPGELSGLREIFLFGDTLVALNRARGPGEAALFSREGDLLGSVYDVRIRGATGQLVTRGPQGWLGTVTRFNQGGQDSGEPEEGDVRTRQRMLFSLDPEARTIGDSLYLFPETYELRDEEGWQLPLFRPEFGEGIDANGFFYITEGFPYRIKVFDPMGRLSWIVERDVPVYPLSEVDVEELRQEVTRYFLEESQETLATFEWWSDWGLEEREQAALWEIEQVDRQAAVPTAEFQSITGALMVAPDGSFWVERADAFSPAESEFGRMHEWPVEFNRPEYWDLFDSAGRFLGGVELPSRFDPMGVRDGLVWGVHLDEYDLEYPVVFEVVYQDGSPIDFPD